MTSSYIQFDPPHASTQTTQSTIPISYSWLRASVAQSNTHVAYIQSAVRILKQVVASHPIRTSYFLQLLPDKVQSTPGAARKWLFLSVTCLSLWSSSRAPALDNAIRRSDLSRASREAVQGWAFRIQSRGDENSSVSVFFLPAGSIHEPVSG